MNLLNKTNLMCMGAVAYCSCCLSQLLFFWRRGRKVNFLVFEFACLFTYVDSEYLETWITGSFYDINLCTLYFFKKKNRSVLLLLRFASSLQTPGGQHIPWRSKSNLISIYWSFSLLTHPAPADLPKVSLISFLFHPHVSSHGLLYFS